MGLWLQSLGPDRMTSLDASGKAHGPIAALHNDRQYTDYGAACRGLFCVPAATKTKTGPAEDFRQGPQSPGRARGESAERPALTC